MTLADDSIGEVGNEGVVVWRELLSVIVGRSW